jgi:hypothetical protein
MPNRSRPAIVTLRMSRSLRDALHDAACAEGCSLNGYAVQVLASAVGDPARFRSGDVDIAGDGRRDVSRDERGVPLRPKDRGEHLAARQAFFDAMAAEDGAAAADRLVRRHELEDPAFFVEWSRRRSA